MHVIDDPETFFRERPGAALGVLQMTAARLDGLTQYLVDVKRQFAGNEDHIGDDRPHPRHPRAPPGAAPAHRVGARPRGADGHDH